MNVFGFELRKIWSAPIVLAILVLGIMFYYLFPLFYIQYFENGPVAEAQMALASDWLDEYGTTLDDQETGKIRDSLQRGLSEFERAVLSVPGAGEAGIRTLEDLHAYQESADPDPEIIAQILEGTDTYRIEQLDAAIRAYDMRASAESLPPSYSTVQIERLLAEQDEAASVLPATVLVNNAREYSADLSSWCVISVTLLLAPTFVRDRIRLTQPLQWTSLTGRPIFSVQLRAGLLSSLLLTILNTAVYAAPFLSQDPLRFADCPLSHAVFPAGDPWVSWTYGEFLLAETALVFLCGLGAGLFALFLSQLSTSYVSMILVELPLLVLAGLLFAPWAQETALYIQEPWSDAGFFLPIGTEFACAATMAGAALLLVCWRARRQRFAEC